MAKGRLGYLWKWPIHGLIGSWMGSRKMMRVRGTRLGLHGHVEYNGNINEVLMRCL
jgi:hypothetical protein